MDFESKSNCNDNKTKQGWLGEAVLKQSAYCLTQGPGALLDHLWRISGPKVAPGSIFGRFWVGPGVHFGAIFRSNFGMFFDMFFDRFFD